MGVFFFGLGYSALATARAIHRLIDTDIPIAGTTRSEESVEALADSPYHLHLFNGAGPGATLAADLHKATHVVLSIPPDAKGDPALNCHKADLDAHQTFRHFRYEVPTPAGTPMFISASGKPVVDRDGNFLGYRGTATDETTTVEARRQAEAAEALVRFIETPRTALILKLTPRGKVPAMQLLQTFKTDPLTALSQFRIETSTAL